MTSPDPPRTPAPHLADGFDEWWVAHAPPDAGPVVRAGAKAAWMWNGARLTTQRHSDPTPPRTPAAPRKYLPWAEAGGPNECAHGYAEGIPCPHCDSVPLPPDQMTALEREQAAEIVRLRTELHRVSHSRQAQREKAEQLQATLDRERKADIWVTDAWIPKKREDELLVQLAQATAELQTARPVVAAARRRLASCDAAWMELGLDPLDLGDLDVNGEWSALRAALAALDQARAPGEPQERL